MAWFICPNCKHRSIDIDGVEGFSEQAPACRRCGFGFLFELLDDYYPAPSTGFVVCDSEGRVLALGRGVFELTGYQEQDMLGRDVMQAFGLSGSRRERTPPSSRANGESAASASSSSCAPGTVSSNR